MGVRMPSAGAEEGSIRMTRVAIFRDVAYAGNIDSIPTRQTRRGGVKTALQEVCR